MEKVFWLMWLADIVGGISVVGIVALIFAGIGVTALVIMAAVESEPEFVLRGLSVVRWLLLPVAIAMLTPSAKTIHILAVASAADAAATTELGAKSLQALNAVLDKVIETAKK